MNYFLLGFIFAVYTTSLLYCVIMIPVLLRRVVELEQECEALDEDIVELNMDIVEITRQLYSCNCTCDCNKETEEDKEIVILKETEETNGV